MVTESVDERGSEGKLTDESGTGLEENVAAALAYVLGFVTGIVMYVLEPDNPTVRFHAVQSIVVSGGIFVVVLVLNFVTAIVTAGAATGVPGSGIVFGLFGAVLGLVNLVVWLAALGLWIYLVVRTYQERNPRIPIAAEIADRYA
jgi:uncharacterized membrane protein